MNRSTTLFQLFLIIVISVSATYSLDAQCKCCADEYRQFDFWIGEWNVSDQTGLVGTSSITVAQDSCMILENWVSAKSAFTGTSQNFYDKKDSLWKQVWLDNQGGSLQLSGGLVEGAMVLTSVVDSTIQKITWTPYDEGSVRQHWQKSENLGTEWTTLFDGIYKKK